MKFEESYRTRQAKQKLERLKNELSEQHKKLVDHYKQANGQPMNDKRGARVFFNKVDKLEDKKSKLVKQIEAQEERVESHFAPATLRKYKKELARLKAEKEQLGNANSKAKKIINSDKVTQWKKSPTVYFIKGLRKVAIELKNGAFEVSSKYAPQTDEEKEIVKEILG